MKTMKNTMKCLVALFIMAMAFVVTGVTTEASGFGKIDGAVELNNYGTTDVDVTIPDAYYMTITQTNATSTTVTASWSPLSGASGYLVLYGNSTSTARGITSTTGTSITITLTETEYDSEYNKIYVVPFVLVDGNAYYDSYNYAYEYMYPAPAKLKKAAVTLWNPTKKSIGGGKYLAEISYARNSYYPDGYSVVVYNLSGKKIKTVTGSTYDGSVSFSIKSGKLKKCWNKGLKYEVKPYKTINGKKYYGTSTGKKVFIPQATVTSATSTTIKWKKVSGAKGYYIYLSTNYGKKYKKVKTVGKNVTSAYVKNYKRSSSSYNPKYSIYVIPYGVKVGGKKYKGTATISHSYYSY